MALGIFEQINKQITDANTILITCKREVDGDVIASTTVLSSFLAQMGKTVDVIIDDFSLPRKYRFIRRAKKIKTQFPHLQQFMLTLDVSEVGVQELSYDLKEEKLNIFITPKTGFLTKDHIHTSQSSFRYDLIIVIGTQDLPSLGNTYTKHKELFHELPIINIDHNPENEHFGQVNAVDITACASAEIIAEYMKHTDKTIMSKGIVTGLLAGMIDETNSFKTEHIKPKSLSLASELVSMGANRKDIIHNLYQTKSLAMLRLWGQALVHMNYDETLELVSTTITRGDITRAGAEDHDLHDIVDELIANSPEEKLALILHESKEDPKTIKVMFHAEKGFDAKKILSQYKPMGNDTLVTFTLEKTTLKKAEEEIIEVIKKQQA